MTERILLTDLLYYPKYQTRVDGIHGASKTEQTGKKWRQPKKKWGAGERD